VSTTTYEVVGMTCAHCVSAVTEEIGQLPGVRRVTVELVAGGTSDVHVTSDHQLDDAQVREAVDEAGYELTGQLPATGSQDDGH
jgi:copper chaperone